MMTKKQIAMPTPAPAFILRADKPGHMRALIAALQELPDECAEGLETLRAFARWQEEAQR